jgi:hypothetical protein
MQNPHAHQNFDDRLEDADILCSSCGEFLNDRVEVQFDDCDEPIFYWHIDSFCCDLPDPHLMDD